MYLNLNCIKKNTIAYFVRKNIFMCLNKYWIICSPQSRMFISLCGEQGTRILSTNHSLARAIQWALEAGYRHIDTAALYLVEDEVGLGVQNYMRDTGVPRDNIYVTTKVSCYKIIPFTINKEYPGMFDKFFCYKIFSI